MKRLYDLDPAEVSLVPRGANRKKFLVYKSLKGSEMGKKQDLEIRNLINSVSPETMKKVDKVLKAMHAKAEKAAGDMEPGKESSVYKMPEDGESAPDHKPLSDRAQAALKAIARIMAPFKDEITDEHVGAVAHEVGIGGSKSEPSDESTPKDEMEKDDDVMMEKEVGAIPEGVKEEHHSEALEMAKKSYADHLHKMGYRKYPDAEMQQKSKDEMCKAKDKKAKDMEDEDEEEEESVGKVAKSAGTLDLSAFPKEQRSQLEMIFKSNQDLVKKNLELEEALNTERDLRITKEFDERARTFKHLGVENAKLSKILKSLASTDVEAYKEVESVLKSADRQLGAGNLYGEIGTRRSGSGDPSSAEARLDALVEQVVQKSDGAQTKEQAYEAVLKTAEGKRLYGEFKAARKDGI